MRSNLEWQGHWDSLHHGGSAYAPAAEVYVNGIDDGDGLAEFGTCVLSRHGIEAYNVGVSVDSPLGHNVTGFVKPGDGKTQAINDGQEQLGPFEGWSEPAQHFIDRGYAEPNGVIWLFEPCIGQTTRNVGDLPHEVLLSIEEIMSARALWKCLVL